MIESRGMNMKKILGMVALMAAPIAANAQAVTIDFEGTIADASGIFAGDSGTITGTYVLNYFNADPTYWSANACASVWVGKAIAPAQMSSGTTAPRLFSLLTRISTATFCRTL